MPNSSVPRKPRRQIYHRFIGGVLILAVSLAGGCTTIVSLATGQLADSLQKAILNSDDPETVRAAMPAYLVMLDGFLTDAPDSASLRLAAAQLNGAFAGVFVADPERARRLANRALMHAEHGVCAADRDFCDLRSLPFDEFGAWVAGLERREVRLAYALASAWAGWLQANSDNWDAIAELPRVKQLMARVAELEPTWDNGTPHIYLGVFETLVPSALGGHPEAGRAHFEKAIEVSAGRQLLARVYYAENYARLVFDRELHDRQLQLVLNADPRVPDLTLINSIAQQQARQLMDESDDYFF